MPSCTECNRTFDTDQGLRVHISKVHPILSANLIKQRRDRLASDKARSASQPASSQPASSQPASSGSTVNQHYHSQSSSNNNPASDIRAGVSPGSSCDVCMANFANENGLRTHMASHPAESNVIRINKLNNLNKLSKSNLDEIARESTSTQPNDNEDDLKEQCEKWARLFQSMASDVVNLDWSVFETKVGEYQRFLREAVPKLPGPKHPNSKYYELRRKKKLRNQSAQYSRSSNPQRTDAKARKRRRDKYDYEVAQYEYYHLRKKIARKVMGDSVETKCQIPMDKLSNYFKSTFSQANESTLEYYPTNNCAEDVEVTLDEVNQVINSISLDTSPGNDLVLIKTIRDLRAGVVIKSMIEVMLASGKSPSQLNEGRTVLIYKGGSATECSNFRPITIYPIIRRIIERVLDKHLRQQVSLNCNQRGFINVPGCHVNSRLINACLVDAKLRKRDCVVAFLDISKAFDRIGHRHIELSLEANGVSVNLKRLIMAMLTSNSIRLNVGNAKSDPIAIKCSVPQGGPLSPILFNIAIDFIYREICDAAFANNYGYRLREDLDALSLTGFADDQAVTANSVDSAIRIIELVQCCFKSIGLNLNSSKSTAIIIKDGKLVQDELGIGDEEVIKGLGEEERVKYLGCSFNNELIFDEQIIVKLTNNMTNLLDSQLLQRNQKLNIMNQYIMPKLVYPLQAAPLNKIPKQHLDTLDVTIRQTAKGIIGLPIHNTPNSMLYADRKVRGLGLICARKEVQLQHYAIAKRLVNVDDELFHNVFNCEEEMNKCKENLGVSGNTTKELRTELRRQEFVNWCSMSYAGSGVKHFETFAKPIKNLSCSEWVAATKLSFGYANLNGVPGVQTAINNHVCRRCRHEKESLSHVLGSCPFGNTSRISRHHQVKHSLAGLLREKGYRTIDEAYCKDGNGSNRFIDILVFDPDGKRAYIIDPTIRYETNEDVDGMVQQEKLSIYGSCGVDLNSRYSQMGEREYEVIGLWFGARGSVGQSVIDMFDRFGLDKGAISSLAENIIIKSIKIIHQHIYNN